MLKNMMRYKDYYAEIAFDSEAEIFHGRVVGMRDVVNFQGRNADELRKEFRNSVEDYLAWCRAEGATPEWTRRLLD